MHDCRSSFLRYLVGSGLEIGAYNNPLSLPAGASAIYADRLTPEQLSAVCPDAQLPDLVCDAENLLEVEDSAFDFVVANHVLEHVTDPLGALQEWYRILRDRGVVFLALPDKRFTFDRARERTPLNHLIEDHASEVPARYRNFEHLKDWATHVENLEPSSEEWSEWIQQQFENGYDVHNHVWVIEDIFRLLRYLRFSCGTAFDLVDYADTPDGDMEFLIILSARKRRCSQFAKLKSNANFLVKCELGIAKHRLKRLSCVRAALRARRELQVSIANFRRKLKKIARVKPQATFIPKMHRSLAASSGPKAVTIFSIDASESQTLKNVERRLSGLNANPVRNWLRRHTCLGTFQCNAVPIRQISKSINQAHYSTGTDPQLSIGTSDGEFPSGDCLVEFTWKADFPCDPRLYFYTRGNTNRIESVPLCGVKTGISQTFVTLPRGITGLRLDPMECAGEFEISSLSIREVRHFSNQELQLLRSCLVVVSPEHNQILKIEHDANSREQDYRSWVEKVDRLSESERLAMKQESRNFRRNPKLSIVMPVYNPQLRHLRRAVDSVRRQIYDNWELCIADDASISPNAHEFLRSLAETDSRIRIVFRSVNGNISEASNSALQLATGDWVLFLDQDDLLHETALFFLAKEIHQFPEARLIYSDEDKITSDGYSLNSSGHELEEPGVRFDPHFKSDWNPFLILGHNYICHFLAIRRELVKQLDGLRAGYEGVQDWDLILRATERLRPSDIRHVPRVLYHWRATPQSTAYSPDAKPFIVERSIKALNDALERRGIAGEARFDKLSRTFRISYTMGKHPSVRIIIPTRDNALILKTCIESIVSLTDYQNCRIIILDNCSQDARTLALFDSFDGHPKVEVRRAEGPFNFSKLNNDAVSGLKDDLFLFLNDDTEIVDPTWLTEMVSLAQLPNIGAVGAKLHYPDGRLQHAGVVLGVGGIANHAFYQQHGDTRGYKDRAVLVQNYSAVTGACMLVPRHVFQAVHGFDETSFPVAFSDVDFCLRLGQLGYQVVWTPHAKLIHHESYSRGNETLSEVRRGAFEKHVQRMCDRWGEKLELDPFYNVNATLARADFSPAFPPRLTRC